MKNLLIVFIALCSHTVFAQDAQVEVTKENLSKKWVFKDVINPDKSEAALAEMRDMLGALSLHFKKDGTYIMELLGNRKGTWQLNQDNKTITTKQDGKSASSSWTVHSLTKNELVASRDEASQKIIFAAQQ
ncbi:hypothetical protein AM493_09765 [Flavobacterium akiainvivens]|uniref:Lipocalin-like domain-containing protein n=1 Tax=Flavobacterium akiainvivens TaxID=1202724 RepID=A0A0M8MIJ5_9FLAO|nr:hypothetical protein [Flavobacterium akiainvivens]KOS06288.1 hypothetical protein AM493_09765 [Flavobacterium akiainvivens]SFQ17135.1 hypothetical protein SAMN05444144_101411 [Flavobacterium akiainvivens]